MYLIYSVVLTVGFVFFLPKVAIDALRSRKYITGLSQRLGKLPSIASSERPIVWLHCVSVGETEAARPFVSEFLTRFPTYLLVVSTTTVAGQRLAKKVFSNQAEMVFYFPIDWAWTTRRVLRVLKPAAVFVMETELWPRLFRECRAGSIPIALINGRISPTSFRRYELIRPFMRRVLDDLSLALMQSGDDADRIHALGLADERILTPGNLKFDSAETGGGEGTTSELRIRFGFNGEQPLIITASTHAPEEMIVIEAFKQIKREEAKRRARVLIAPRHPERFDEVAALLEDSGLTWSRRSNAPTPADASCDVVLLDSIGELRAAYSLADLAFVGGSIAPHGGHNVLEPAARGICVVTGPHTENFAAVTKALLDQDAVVQMPEVPVSDAAAQLAAVLTDLLTNEQRRAAIGDRALEVCNQNRGAAERAIQAIATILPAFKTAGESPQLSSLQATTAR